MKTIVVMRRGCQAHEAWRHANVEKGEMHGVEFEFCADTRCYVARDIEHARYNVFIDDPDFELQVVSAKPFPESRPALVA